MLNYSNAIFPPELPAVLEKLGTMAAKTAYYNFEWRYVTLVMFNTMQLLVPLKSFFRSYKQSIIIKLGKFVPRVRVAIPQFVLFGQDSTEIVDMIRWLEKTNYDSSGKYVIVCTAIYYERCDENQVFEVLSEMNIINIVFYRSNGDNSSIAFAYDKVLPDKCNNNVPYIKDVQDGCIDDNCLKSMFPIKLKNFHKCPLLISTFHQPPFMYLNNNTNEPSGGDGAILKLLASILNATLVVKTPVDGGDWGHFENNNWTGSLGDVYNDRVHASVCSLPLTANKYGNFQISYVYNYMDIVWTAQLPALKPFWEKLLHPFKLYVRVLLFLMFVGIVLTNALTKTVIWEKLLKALNVRPPRKNLLFYSWILFLGMPISRMSSKQALLMIIFCWIWFSFIIRSGYQAALISSLKKRMYEEYFINFDKILFGKEPFGGPANIKEYYTENRQIYENWVPLELNEAYEILSKISNGSTNFVLALNKEIIIQHLIQSNGTRHLQIIPEKIVNSPTVMFFKKHSSLVAPVNQILSYSVETGFTQLWENRFLSFRKHFFKYLEDQDQDKPLTFDNIKGCLFMLAFGWILSIIFFLVEVYFGKYGYK